MLYALRSAIGMSAVQCLVYPSVCDAVHCG